MNPIRSSLLITSLLLATAGLAASQTTEITTAPADRNTEAWWPKRHESRLEQVKQGGWQLVFLGDSITQGWEGGGKAVWEEFYAPRKALNLGFSGDRTEHVLWRLNHGEIDGLNPKLVVIMIGTNNTGHRQDRPEQIADGVQAIIKQLRTKLPQSKLLLLAIFPRGETTHDLLRVNNDKTNAILKRFADEQSVFFLDINAKLLGADGTLSREIMPDLLHPKQQGYRIWAEAIEPTVARLLGEKR